MATLLAFALAMSGPAAAPAPAQTPAPRGASVQATATVTILRAETASEQPGPDGLARQVNRRPNGQTAIEFE